VILHRLRTSGAKVGLSGIAVIAVIVLQAGGVKALCNPGRAPGLIGSQYQGGNAFTSNVQVAGVNIEYYTPYVQQGDGSSSAAWQMISSTECTNPYIPSFPVAQAGFAQEPGDSHDKVFYETIDCSNYPGPAVEVPNTPASGRFNVVYNVSTGEFGEYFGAAEIGYQYMSWTPNSIFIAAEVHDENDQGYGGYNNKQTFTTPEWQDSNGVGHTDRLALTPNNVSGSNDTNPLVPTEPWLKMTLGPGTGFSLYDSACAS
jgi:hypothetical protein